MQHNRHCFEYMFMGAKQNYVLVLRGFVSELEQILKMTVCELGKAGLHAQIRI